ncbi:hypothetical protein [Streptomyces sp. NPDC096142]|uniref:hypothetical protein n=1 Tax=Streptomyces sp. NPDC096142 TaxID=3366077 RepID=UPI0037FB2067
MQEPTGHPQRQPSPRSGYTPEEIATAARLRVDARARIDDIETRAQTATTREEHAALSRESARAWGDYKSAGNILTEGAEA